MRTYTLSLTPTSARVVLKEKHWNIRVNLKLDDEVLPTHLAGHHRVPVDSPDSHPPLPLQLPSCCGPALDQIIK